MPEWFQQSGVVIGLILSVPMTAGVILAGRASVNVSASDLERQFVGFVDPFLLFPNSQMTMPRHFIDRPFQYWLISDNYSGHPDDERL